MPAIAATLAWDAATPAPIIAELHATTRSGSRHGANLLTHPNLPAAAGPTDALVTGSATVDWEYAFHRPGISDACVARAARDLPTEKLLTYCSRHRHDPHPAVLTELAYRDVTHRDTAAIALAATAVNTPPEARVHALSRAVTHPGAFDPAELASIVTAATRVPDLLPELAAAARDAANEVAQVLTALCDDPHSAHQLWVTGLHTIPLRGDDRSWSRALAATDDPTFPDVAREQHGSTIADSYDVLRNPFLAGSSAYWRAHCAILARIDGYTEPIGAILDERTAFLACARASGSLGAVSLEFLSSALDPADLDVLADLSSPSALAGGAPALKRRALLWALHPSATRAHRSAVLAATAHPRNTQNKEALDARTTQVPDALGAVVAAVDHGALAALPLPILDLAVGEPVREGFVVAAHLAPVLRAHHEALSDLRVLRVVLALEESFTGSLTELLDTATTIVGP